KLGHNEQEVMDFGKFKAVSILLLGLMNVFHGWFGNYALAIILLTILVKSVLFPLQNKANKSMKRMSVLSPELSKLREKYGSDPARMNAETMKLYRANGMSPLAPLGGCWPMLIQMPIFFGFLYMLGVATELRNSSFLWVHDLSQPDTVGRLFGFPINVLPLAMMGTQFWQMRLTPRTGDPAQQKTLMFMPLLFGFFCYSFAAALALYYTVQGLLTILQLYITRQNAAPATAVAAGATPAAPAKFVPVKEKETRSFGGFGSSANYGKKGSSKRSKP
ncbi:MAG: membrane protein insertase YidC, partial [Rhodospirillales bacterium]|nr:membrane protein insertase YidC [Acetobacter sp.]